MTILDDIDLLTPALLAEYEAGGYEPDGIALTKGTQVENIPEALGYGRDLSCAYDCDEYMSEVDPMSVQAVGESLIRRLSTPHGRVINDPELLIAVGEDPDYGYNLANMLHIGMSKVEIMAKQDLAAAECLKDDRVQNATVTITQVAGNQFSVHLYAVLKTGEVYSQILPLTDADAVLQVEAQ